MAFPLSFTSQLYPFAAFHKESVIGDVMENHFNNVILQVSSSVGTFSVLDSGYLKKQSCVSGPFLLFDGNIESIM